MALFPALAVKQEGVSAVSRSKHIGSTIGYHNYVRQSGTTSTSALSRACFCSVWSDKLKGMRHQNYILASYKRPASRMDIINNKAYCPKQVLCSFNICHTLSVSNALQVEVV